MGPGALNSSQLLRGPPWFLILGASCPEVCKISTAPQPAAALSFSKVVRLSFILHVLQRDARCAPPNGTAAAVLWLSSGCRAPIDVRMRRARDHVHVRLGSSPLTRPLNRVCAGNRCARPLSWLGTAAGVTGRRRCLGSSGELRVGCVGSLTQPLTVRRSR